ncbi:MAG: 30S ribosomal protein S8e [Candidatus Hodarchaeaceae archaeon]|nr:30S ribosomal protein S8e [Candidatus Hodarchaeaceae archaeon]
MAKWQGRSLKKPSGGRIWARRMKRKREMGREFIEPKLGPTKHVKIRTLGGNIKSSVLSTDVANVMDPKTGGAKKVKILTVVENPADPHFVRRNVLTRGAIIETELGKARVMSRPGQSGTVDAVLLEAKPVKAEKPAEKPAAPGKKS